MSGERGAEDRDRALAGKIAADGDEAAFRTLYRRHTPYLYQFALRILGGSEVEVEDVSRRLGSELSRGSGGSAGNPRFARG